MYTTEDISIKETKIPDIVQSKADAAFSSIKMEGAEMQKIKQRKNRTKLIFKRIGITIGAAVATLAVGIGVIGLAAPTFAAKLPLIGGIFAQTESQLTYSGDYSDKAQVLTAENESGLPDTLVYTAEDQGYTVTASEVYSDGYSVYLTMEITSDEQDFSHMAEIYTTNNADTTAALMYSPLNWKLTDDSGEVIADNNEANGRLQGKVVDEHTFIGMLKLDMPAQFNNANINLDIYELGFDDSRPEYQNYDSEKPAFAEGSWEFNIPVSVDSDVRIITSDEEAGGFILQKVMISDFQVVTETVFPEGASDFGGVVILDQDGNKLQASDETISDNIMIDRFAIQGKDLDTLQIYVFENYDDWFDAYKAIDPDVWDRAIIVRDISLE